MNSSLFTQSALDLKPAFNVPLIILSFFFYPFFQYLICFAIITYLLLITSVGHTQGPEPLLYTPLEDGEGPGARILHFFSVCKLGITGRLCCSCHEIISQVIPYDMSCSFYILLTKTNWEKGSSSLIASD